ncbi:MAG: hypothetical protein FJ335_13550, partial [Sphingomonadales bacterium]|nr:hypothetical protein [Sphingomonadales bacterium]
MTALLSQLSSSGSSLIVNVIAARTLGVSAFGEWALAWIIVYGVGAFHAAMVQTPVQVLTRHPGGDLDKPFIRSLMQVQIGAVIIGGMASVAIAALFRLIPLEPETILAVGILTGGFMLVEFNRRAVLVLSLFQIGSGLEIARGILVVAVSACMAFLRGRELSLGALLLAIAGAYVLIGAIGHILVYRRVATVPSLALGTTIRRCWNHSRWLILLALSQRLGPDLITVMIGDRAGNRAIGGLRSMIQILNVFNVAFQTLQVSLPVKIVQLHREYGNSEVRRLVGKSIAATTALFILVCGFLWFFGPSIVGILLGSKYIEFAWILPWLSLSYLAMFSGFPFACWAHALHASRYLLIANLSAAAVAQIVMALSVWPSPLASAVAALVAYSVTEAVILIQLVVFRV